jgi:DNA gyrase subunit A
VLKRDAVAKVVLNNLYKHTQLQDNFGCNMLALVDGVPRTLSLDAFVRHWVDHQIDVIRRRTAYLLREAEERAHILRGYVKALDQLDAVISLIRSSPSADEARGGLMALLDVDEIQATEILNLQLRRLAALERQKTIDELASIEAEIAGVQAILASDARQREIVDTELGPRSSRSTATSGARRFVPYDGDMTAEDLIPEEPVVVTITRGGYAKRTRVDLYRSQKRGGKGRTRRAAQAGRHRRPLLRDDDPPLDPVLHEQGPGLPRQGLRAARGQPRRPRPARRQPAGVRRRRAHHPGPRPARLRGRALPRARDRRAGIVKKTRLTEYDSPRSGGLIAVNLREDDELISAQLVSADDDLLLVSRKGSRCASSRRRPAAADGPRDQRCHGMRFRPGDELLSMEKVSPDSDAYVLTATDGGWAKRTHVEEYRVQGRGGLGIRTHRLTEDRGSLVGALVVSEGDEVFAITSNASRSVRPWSTSGSPGGTRWASSWSTSGTATPWCPLPVTPSGPRRMS